MLEVSRFFDGLWENTTRRKALIYQWLAYTPTTCADRSPVGYCTYIVNAICVERADLQFSQGGSVQLNNLINLHFDWFLLEERIALMNMCGKEHFGKLKKMDEKVVSAGGFFFNHLVLKRKHRELLMRDFVSMCIAQNVSKINLFLPLYALVAVQNIQCEQRTAAHKTTDVCLEALNTAEYVLMGLGLSQNIPIRNNKK
jgi:hypothetical protein